MYCYYYHAYIVRSETWFFVATLRSYEHLAFDRTYDPSVGLFEIFVPEDCLPPFLELMEYHVHHGIVSSYTHKPNRLRYHTSL